MKLMNENMSDEVTLRPTQPLRAKRNAYYLALLLVVGATLISSVSAWLFGSRNLSLPFIVAIVLAGGWFGLRPALTAAVAAFFFFHLFVVAPLFSFKFDPPALIALVSFPTAALFVGAMAGQLKDRANAATDQLRRLTTLLAASRDLSAAITAPDVAQSLTRNLKSGGNVEAAVWSVAAGAPVLLAATEAAAAAGVGSETNLMSPVLEGITADVRELRTVRGDVGLAAIWADQKVATPASDDWLEALLQLGAIGLDRVSLAEDVTEARLVAEREGLRTALLSSLSHDLRTPIATILASASSLAEYDTQFDVVTRRELLDTIQEQAERLNRYVSNLLDMTRLESGVLDLKRVLVDPVEAMISALEHSRRGLRSLRIERDFTASNVMISVDPVLIEQALVNILENAAKFSPPGSVIRASVALENDEAVLAIADQGPGVSPEERPQIFKKFFRGQADRHQGGGVGLGLAVTKGVVEAFGGRIDVDSPVWEGRGAQFVIRLPAQQAMEASE